MTLTADMIAHAIVASARAYGDDPIRAVTSRAYGARRCLPAAIYALWALGLGSFESMYRILRVNRRQVQRANSRPSGVWWTATLVAISDVRRALLRSRP